MSSPDPAPTVPPALELRGIDKRFGPVHANRQVDLVVRRGQIHGLIGENGAGKSTLMNIVYGLHRPDAGQIVVDGRPVEVNAPQAAIETGIGMVHQHFMLVEKFTALENVILGAERGALLSESLQNARRALENVAQEYGLDVPLDVPVGELPVGIQQRVEILKALYRQARILILDEPTAVLTPQEADALFRFLGRLRDEGNAVILVTHKLREIMATTDRVTVLRLGSVVADLATRETSLGELAEKMIGRPIVTDRPRRAQAAGALALTVRKLEVADDRGTLRVRGVSFDLRSGEILGLAGVSGNGQSELLEALAGIRRPRSGQIAIGNRVLDSVHDGPRERRRLGIAHVPEDRLRRGVVSPFSAEDNAILGYETRSPFQRGGVLRRRAIRGACERWMAAHDVRPPAPALRLSAFSGGNQQKLVLAREIETDPKILLVGQPTRGVDIGAIEFIHRRLIEMRDAGKALLLVSVELEEILALADRILVMHAGEVVGEVTPATATEERLGLMMAGVREARP